MNILNGLLFSQLKLHHRCSTGLYKDLRSFQSEAKVEQIIAIVTTHSVSCFCINAESIIIKIFLPKSKAVLIGILNRPPDK